MKRSRAPFGPARQGGSLFALAMLLLGLRASPIASANSPAQASHTAAPQALSDWSAEAFKSSPGVFLSNPDVRLLLDHAHRRLGFVGTGTKPPGFDFTASWQNRDQILVPGRGSHAALGRRVAFQTQLAKNQGTFRRQATTWAYPLRPAPNGASAALVISVDQTGFQSVTLAYLPPSRDPADGEEFRTWQGRVVKADPGKNQLWFFQSLISAAGVTAPTFADATLRPLSAATSSFAQQGAVWAGLNGAVNLLHQNAGAYDAQHRDSGWWKTAVSRDPQLGQVRETAKQLLGQGAKTAEEKLKEWVSKAEKFFKKALKFLDKFAKAIPAIMKVLGWLGFL